MPVDQNARTAPYIKVPPQERSRRFVSLRWRVLTPLVAALMAVLMCAAYGVGYAFTQGSTRDAAADLTVVGRSLAQNAVAVGRTQRTEVDRIAFTQGVPAGIQRNDGAALQPIVEPLAALAGLDLVVIGNENGSEVIGLQRVAVSGSIDYAVTDDTSLASLAAVQSVLNGADSASEIVQVERRPMLVTAGAVLDNGVLVGVVLVGEDINRILNTVRGGNNAQIALFAAQGDYIGATFTEVTPLKIDPALYVRALGSTETVTFQRVRVGDADYNAAFFPFVIGQTPLGVLAAYQSDYSSTASEFGRQLLSLFFALTVGVVCVVGYVMAGRGLGRLDKVRRTADQLAAGAQARTGMKPHDEIGEVGAALDRFAAAAQVQVRQLQSDLWQQRRQLAHLNAILDSLPDGVVVQDMDGRVMTMNAAARRLLTGDTEGALALRAWSVTVEQRVGELLAPGIVALGDSTELKVGGRVLHVEAAAVQSIAEKHLGTVLLLRDITAEMVRDAKRDALIDAIANDVHVSITQRVQAAALEAGTKPSVPGDSLATFAREIAKDARAMQRLIADYRDLTLFDAEDLRAAPLNVVDLLSDLMDEWRPAASAAEIGLDVSLPDEDIHILGDEKRLKWALGTLVDNAIKYSGGRGTIRLGARLRENQSHIGLTVQDEGAGIALEEQPHVFERFYRGNPTLADGTRLDVPGTGQGLYWAQKLIAAHGGQIALASQPGGGTHVNVALPLTAGVAMEVRESLWDMPTHTAILAQGRQD